MHQPAPDDHGQSPPTEEEVDSRQSSMSESASVPSIMAVTALPSGRRASSPIPRQTSPANRHFLPSSSQHSHLTTRPDNRKTAGRLSDAFSSVVGHARTLSTESNARDLAPSRQAQARFQGDTVESSFGIDADPFARHPSGSSTHAQNSSLSADPSFATANHTSSTPTQRKHRGSLFVAASDVLGLGRVGHSISKRMSKRNSIDQSASSSVPQTQHWKGLPWKGKVKPKGHWALQPASSTHLVPDVIEISAAKSGLTSVRDEEEENERRERDRLREAAAESIGISPLFREDASSRVTESDGMHFDDESVADVESRDPDTSIDDDPAGKLRALDRSRTSMNGSTKQQDGPTRSQIQQGRENKHYRSSSVSGIATPTTPSSASHRLLPSFVPPFLSANTRVQKSSVTTAGTEQLPPYPCLLSALDSISSKSTPLVKFFPSSSLLRLGFSRQWRARTIILTTPPRPKSPSLNSFRPFSPSDRLPPVCHLHLFKSSGADERELERLEVNANSVVFVAEEEIGGKRSVVKVGGVDVGARRQELNVEENGQTMWLLSITDANEAQDWITALKNAVLDQRAAKAGFGMPTHLLSTSGPKGDLDVMLSMRAQDVASTVRAQTQALSRSSNDETLSRISDSTTPTKSWSGERRRSASPSSRMVSLKGLFSVPGRARSMSQSRSDEDSPTTPVDAPSFTSRGTTLLNMIRAPSGNTTSELTETDTKSAPSSPLIAAQTLPVPILNPGPILSRAEMNLEKTSLNERDRELPEWYSIQSHQSNRGDTSTLSAGPALLPAPRNRRPWTSAGLLNSNMKQEPFTDTGAPSRRSFQSAISLHGARLSLDEKSRPSSPDNSVGTATGAVGATEIGSKRTSLSSSVSSFVSATADRDQFIGRSSLSVQRRMRTGKLPKMLSPPAGPPPSVPVPAPLSASSGEPNPRSLSDRSPSRSSSIQSSIDSEAVQNAGITPSRRLSDVSAFSSGSRNYNALRKASNSLSPKRTSIPPPQRPAPTSALPPTPSQTQCSNPPRRSSFRESLSHRSLRFSLSPQYAKNGSSRDETLRPRSASTGPVPSATSLPPPSITIAPPAPPPSGPLPPTPRDPVPNRSSIRERLRMKSAPSTPPLGMLRGSGPPTTLPGSPPLVTVESVASLKDSVTMPTPPVPIGEPITAIPKDLNFLNMSSPIDTSAPSADDMDFLNMSTPLTTTFPKQIPGKLSDYPPPEQPNGSPPTPEMTALPPPPRRGRNGTISEKDKSCDSNSLTSSSVPPMAGSTTALNNTQPEAVAAI